jgi:hypothetical protein
VFLDDVQFEKNYYQNRCKLKSSTSDIFWFGIPVKKAPLSTAIKDIEISDVFNRPKLVRSLELNYRKSPYFELYFDGIKEIITSDSSSLLDTNLASIQYVISLLGFNSDFQQSSLLELESSDSTSRLIEICNSLTADKYLSGIGGKKYLDFFKFKENNIELLWQNFNLTDFEYSQFNGTYVSGLSIIDVLMNIGHEKARSMIVLNSEEAISYEPK